MRQAAFAAALLDPDAALPDGLIGADPGALASRFAIYRNNVTASLTRALEAGFPVVRRLVGPEFFGAMAVIFLRAHPPRTRQIMLYGDEFADFLSGFPPVAHLGYLPDVARLEQALRESYHAGDSTALPHAALARLVPDARLTLAPALRLITSRWPIDAIWRANTAGGPPPVMAPQDVLVLRPALDPAPHLLPPGGALFVQTLQGGAPLAEASQRAGAGFDPTATLRLLVEGGAIVGASQ